MAFNGWFQLSSILFVAGYAGTEISSVKENNVSLVKQASVTAMVPGSFFQDTPNERIYISPTDGTNPNVSGNTYIFYVWLGFCNKHPDGNPIDFQIQGNVNKYDYDPIIDTDKMNAITQGISELYRQVVQSQLGSLNFINPAFWYSALDKYIFHFSKVVVKIGSPGDAYGDYITAFTGLMTNPRFSDSGIAWGIIDIFDRELGSVPPNSFNTTDYPNMDLTLDGSAVPVLLGRKGGITPALIDTTNFTYLISETTFGGVTYPLNAVQDVYKDGITLTLTTDYTVNLNAGTFTLTADPVTSDITCDARGLEIQFNFGTGLFTAAYSNNIAEITFFILHILNSSELINFDLTSFDTIKAFNTFRCGILLNSFTETRALLPTLQSSGLFHLLTDLDGKFIAPPMKTTTAATNTFDHNDCRNFSYSEDSQNVRRGVIVNYNENLSTGTPRQQIATRDEIGYIYQVQAAIEFDTIVSNDADARDTAEYLLDFFKTPAKYSSFWILDGEGFDFLPLEKILLQRTILDDMGNQVEQIEEATYYITNIAKNVFSNSVQVTVRKDVAQTSGIFIVQVHNNDQIITISGDSLVTA